MPVDRLAEIPPTLRRSLQLGLAIVIAIAPAGAGGIQIGLEDGSIDLGVATDESGTDETLTSNTDDLVFNNTGSDERALWLFNASSTLHREADGAAVTGSITFQGSTHRLADLTYGAQTSDGNRTPWELTTDTDRSGELLGWTQPSTCDIVDHKGTFSVRHYDASGIEQSAANRTYMVCDNKTEIYVDDDEDLSDADLGYRYDQATSSGSTTAADYEIDVLGVPYVFYAAPAGSDVTIKQGAYVPKNDTTVHRFALQVFPDGMPAGDVTVDVTANAHNITA